jgi:hypothetical protein
MQSKESNMTEDKPADPWAYRPDGLKCKTCIWYVEKQRANADSLKVIGRCRRHAPTMNGFVPVYPADWCGDHRIDENKL